MRCSSQTPSSGPTQPSSNWGLRLLLAHVAARNCPWQQDIASLKVTPLPEDSREPMISWCGDMKTGPFASIWHNPEKSSQSRGRGKQVQLRPPSQLHCGSAPPVQCLPHFYTRVSPKMTHQWIFYIQLSQSRLQGTQLEILQLFTVLKSSQFNC